MFELLRSHRLTFLGRHDVAGGVSSLAFRPDEPVAARAGQHGVLRLSATAMKPFSLASAPEEDTVLIGTSLLSGSSFKRRLAALQPGDGVRLYGPTNEFTLDGAGGEVVMLAQGVGITPLRSMLAHIAVGNLTVDASLIHVAQDGHAYRDDTERWATSAVYPRHADEFRTAAAAAVRAHPDATFFIAGASAFVSATAVLLRVAGVVGGRIRQDKYLGYKPRTPLAAEPADHGATPTGA